LYPANSIFTRGYLTTGGQGHAADLALIEATGFQVAEITDA
jgi:biotin synthase-like enzyme